jgi:AraC-like DNA-binding protein
VNISAPDPLNQPLLPASNALLLLDLAAAHGLPEKPLLAALQLSKDQLTDGTTRLSVRQCTGLMALVKQQTGLAAIGYEMGFRTPGTAHGLMGFGVLSSVNMHEALALGMQFFQLRNATFKLVSTQRGDWIELSLQDLMPMAPMRQAATEWVLLSLVRMGEGLLGPLINNARQQLELNWPWPEPAYHTPYAGRLPPCRFNAPMASMRFPVSWLAQSLPDGAAASAQLARKLCEQEMALIQPVSSLAARVRAELAKGLNDSRYPSRDEMAARLHMSASTLKRRLQSEGFSFSALLDEARHRDAATLLDGTALRIEDIAERLGFQNTANFTRAFKQWAGITPSAWREQGRPAAPTASPDASVLA